MNKRFKSIISLVLCLAMLAAMATMFVGCDNPEDQTPITYTYNTTTSTMPSNWNELTYQDNNDTQILSYISSSFFDYDYKFENDQKYNADGSINVDGIVVGAYTTNYSAATKLEDVTSTVDAKWGYTDAQKAEGGYAWKITLRDDLKWDDGTPITAADFVYSMKQQLDPAFMNYRGNTYYDTLRIKNSRAYFFQNQEGTYETVASFGYATNAAAIEDGKVIVVNMFDFWGAEGAPKITSYDETTYVPVLDYADTCANWVAYNDSTYYFDYAYFVDTYPEFVKADDTIDFDAVLAFNASVPEHNETAAEDDQWEEIDLSEYYFSAAMIYGAYGTYFEVGASYATYVAIYVENTERDVAWESVGIYSEGNAIVICLDKAYALLMEDGSLSYMAAYYMASLPLVKESLYESCKKAPAEGATLWTTNYNTSLATTASWGPYKLAEFEGGSHYKLVKNENWYGWNMEEYKNQYKIETISCRKVEEWNTQWQGFLAGIYDDASLQTENIDEYKDSKYVTYAPSTGTFGMQLYSNLNVLKESENNNGILAILEFRQAINLALNRSDVVEKIWPGTATPCFGLINSEYYYDIENSASLDDQGVYRNTEEAKAGILRAYGFTEENGKWSNGSLSNLSLEDAYNALTGYNPTLAKEKMVAAIEELTNNAEYYGYDSTKNITIIYGSSVDNAKQRFRSEYIQSLVDDLTKGTALEDKIDIVFDASAGSQWATAFRNGLTQIGFGYGFSGNPFNPFDIVGAFTDPDDNLNYHMYWDTSLVDLTITLPEIDGEDYVGEGETITMSIQNWYFCLNGLAAEENAPKTYNWDAGYAPAKARVTILAALEEAVIKESRSIMLIGDYGGSFLGAKFSYITEDYNTFMGFGGIRYMVINYNDAEWAEYVQSNNNDLTSEYKKSE